MGFDIYTVRKGESEEEFYERETHEDDEYFRATIFSMPKLCDAMERAGVFEHLDPIVFQVMHGDLVTAEEARLIADLLGGSTPPSDPGDAQFVEKWRRYCERAAKQDGFRVC